MPCAPTPSPSSSRTSSPRSLPRHRAASSRVNHPKRQSTFPFPSSSPVCYPAPPGCAACRAGLSRSATEHGPDLHGVTFMTIIMIKQLRNVKAAAPRQASPEPSPNRSPTIPGSAAPPPAPHHPNNHQSAAIDPQTPACQIRIHTNHMQLLHSALQQPLLDQHLLY